MTEPIEVIPDKVLIGYLHSYELPVSFHKSFMDLMGRDLSTTQFLHSWAIVKAGTMGIPEARNEMCEKFLDTPAEWLFMIDTDMGFQPVALEQLMHVADRDTRPIVGGLCFAYREAGSDGMNGHRTVPQPTMLDWRMHPDGYEAFIGRAHYPVNALIQVGATGGAFVLIHRSVIERIFEKYGPNWFTRLPLPTGALMGEDISFFYRTRELEIPLFVHTGIRTSHFKHLWVSEMDFWHSFLAPPAKDLVDVIIPVLHRPQNIEPLMQSLTASTGLATAWFVCEEDDDDEIAEVIRCGGEVLTNPQAHTFAEKVNVAYEATTAPWVLLCGDDVRFRPGWLDSAQDVARRYEAKVVGTNDLNNPRVLNGEHATHPMISRAYIDELGASWDGPGIVCHEGYHHWYVDDEIVTVAKQRGTFTVALASEVEHLHPIWGTAETDEVYALGAAHSEEDAATFQQRFRKFAA